jgi:hypothetical protein
MGEMSDFMKRYLTSPRYSIMDFDEEDIRYLRDRLKNKIDGLVPIVSEAKSNEFIDQLSNISFAEDDTVKCQFTIHLNGTEILAILGESKVRRAKQKKFKCSVTGECFCGKVQI